MGNINRTTLWCDDKEKFDEVTKNINFCNCTSNPDPEPGKLRIKTAGGVPHDEIKELSAKHPDMILEAKFSFEEEDFNTKYSLEYKNGKATETKIEPNYFIPAVSHEIEENLLCYDSLLWKLIAVFERLDVVKYNDKGERFIDWVEGEVTATVEHEGYKIKGTKRYDRVDDIKIFKANKIEKIQWEEVRENNGVPF